jgi:hypothetical protein
MTKIVAFSGKKQAGKSTAGNFLFGLQMWTILHPETNEPLISSFRIDEKGRLIIPVDFGPEKGGIQDGIFNPISQEPAVKLFLSELVWPTVKMYSFADSLKDICAYLFDLSVEQLYGTNEEKNTSTKLIWVDMPGFPKNKSKTKLEELGFKLSDDWTPDNYMTAREVLQYVGTEIFRKMSFDVWANSTLKNIKTDNSELAIITDCRFPNEVKKIQEGGGVVIRFTRAPFKGQDEHASETMLDPEVYDWSQFNAVIDNKEMSIEEQNNKVFEELVRLEVLEPETANDLS